MEDLIMGGNHWNNTPGVIRETFNTVHEKMVKQGEALRRLELKYSNVASKEDIRSIHVSMSNKPTFGEMKKHLESFVEEIGEKNAQRLDADLIKRKEFAAFDDFVRSHFQRTDDNSKTLKDLVLQQQEEITALKSQVRELIDFKNRNEEQIQKLVTSDSRSKVDDRGTFELVRTVNNLQNEMDQQKHSIDLRVDKAEKDARFAVETINELRSALDERPKRVEILEDIAKSTAKTTNLAIEQLTSTMDEICQTSASQTESRIRALQRGLDESITRTEAIEILDTKTSIDQVDDRVCISMQALVEEVREAMEGIQNGLVTVINKKAFKEDVSKLLLHKANIEDIKVWLATKVGIADIRDALTEKAENGLVKNILKRLEALEQLLRYERGHTDIKEPFTSDATDSEVKMSTDELLGMHGMPHMKFTKENIDSTSLKSIANNLRALSQHVHILESEKASVKDMCMLLDQKANVKDFNEALAEVETRRQNTDNMPHRFERETANTKKDALAELSNEIAKISQVVNAELVTGRWIWSSGKCLKSNLVPWNIECVNTSTDNFLWKQDTSTIVTVAPGLYELQLGFFTDHDPEVQVTINQEIAFFTSHQEANSKKAIKQNLETKKTGRAGSPASNTVARPTNFFKRSKHSAGNVTGWTTIEFVALPGRANISVTYSGELGTQGFFNLRKM